MRFFIRHRERIRVIAITSFLSLNFFMIAACYTGEDGAWASTFLIAGIAIVCSLICHFTQGMESHENNEKFNHIKNSEYHEL
ncbi:MAG: hypothetical protein K2K25_03505 [Muribaculaceae bacterium]|nr:hypothetical protein [Muribaculaceae bacterium]